MPRPTIALAVRPDEGEPIAAELLEAGYTTHAADGPAELERLLAARSDIAVAIIDGDAEPEQTDRLLAVLRERRRPIPTLIIATPGRLRRIVAEVASVEDEPFERPYALDALRWRIEAMCIRAEVHDDGSGAILGTDPGESGDFVHPARVVAVFNPKGGVGKTTIAMNLAAALAIRRGRRVLLVDADTVSGHVALSLGLEHVRTIADSWLDEAEGGPIERFLDVAAAHPSGMRALVLAADPSQTEILEPRRVASGLTQARRGVDDIVIDLHSAYSPLNRAILELADRIVVPTTPELAAIRATVQFGDLATALGIDDRLALVANRANSGVSVTDLERAAGLPAIAQIRSAGMHLVRAANEGQTVVERFPRERIAADFDALAEAIAGPAAGAARQAERGRLFGALLGRREPART